MLNTFAPQKNFFMDFPDNTMYLGVKPVDYPHNKLPSKDYFHTASAYLTSRSRAIIFF